MDTSFIIQPATRVGVNPLIVLYSESGCGKTFSSLLLARGIAGPTGKIVMGDSEARRGSLYADVIPGGYETFDLGEPFSPSRYIAALDAINAAGAAVGIIDSGSHEWEGPGGVNDMAMENESRSGRAGLHNWRIPKLEHAKFIQRLLRSKIPIIMCLRAKHKTRQVKDERGKTQIVKDEYVTPIQSEDFIFEATCHLEVLPDHSIRLTKPGHPDLKKCFPEDFKGPIKIEHGAAIAQWAKAAGGPRGAQSQASSAEPDDLLLQIREASDAGELTRLAADAKVITDEQRKAKLRDAVSQAAKRLRCTWDRNSASYITHD